MADFYKRLPSQVATITGAGSALTDGTQLTKITDGTNNTTITDVSGKKSLDVNVTDITISAINDSIKSYTADGSGTAITSTSAALDVYLKNPSIPVTGSLSIQDGVNTQGLYAALTVGTSAVEVKVGASRLTGRNVVLFQNLSSSNVYWGFDSSVTSSNGMLIPAGTEKQFAISDAVPIFVIGSAASLDCRIVEAK